MLRFLTYITHNHNVKMQTDRKIVGISSFVGLITLKSCEVEVFGLGGVVQLAGVGLDNVVGGCVVAGQHGRHVEHALTGPGKKKALHLVQQQQQQQQQDHCISMYHPGKAYTYIYFTRNYVFFIHQKYSIVLYKLYRHNHLNHNCLGALHEGFLSIP